VFKSIVLAVTIVLVMNAARAAEGPRQFSCSGNMIEPISLAPSPKSMQLISGPAQKISIDLGQGNSIARMIGNNNIQLKFRTKDFVGEFFHYTGDLILIYKSGHLARLTCTRG
jgi:hypothetical protein